MTHALETAEATDAPLALTASSLWMLPILLFQLILQLFGQHLVKLREMRRSKPMPKDWRDFYPDLRDAEWPVHVLLGEGARQILSGQKLDLASIRFDPEPPETFQPPMPRSAVAMHQRMEDLARFNADPERHVRRHADRIRERGDDDSGFLSPNPANPATAIFRISNPATNFPRRPIGDAGVSARSRPAAIRGPPRGCEPSEKTQRPNPPMRSARMPPHAQYPEFPQPILNESFSASCRESRFARRWNWRPIPTMSQPGSPGCAASPLTRG